MTQGSPALRVNPGLSDRIPLGFMDAINAVCVRARHRIGINLSGAWDSSGDQGAKRIPIKAVGHPAGRSEADRFTRSEFPMQPRRVTNPKGIESFSPALAMQSPTLGCRAMKFINPEGVEWCGNGGGRG